MNTTISSGRYYGRIKVAIDYLLMRYGLTVDDSMADNLNPTLIIAALTTKVSDEDKEFCGALGRMSLHIEADSDSIETSDVQEGINEGHYLVKEYGPNFRDYILKDEDFLTARDAKLEAERKRNKRNIRIGCIALAVIIIGIITYNLPYFAEKRMYSKVEKVFYENDYWEYDNIVDEYLIAYPDGRHKDEVLYLPIKKYWEAQDVAKTLMSVSRYLRECPNGAQISEVKNIYNQVWNAEISKYEKETASTASTEGRDFVKNMLIYMRDHNIRTIYVDVNSQLELKEYSEYPADIRNAMELSQPKSERFQLPGDMNTITDRISKDDVKDWANEVISSLQNGFDKVLTEGFIEFEKRPEGEVAKKDAPYVSLTYIVKTQESRYGSYTIPEIWTYTQTENGYVINGGLYLGISLDFIANFIIPGNQDKFEVSAGGDPGDTEIRNVDPSEVYTRMCERCVVSFTNKIESSFGI